MDAHRLVGEFLLCANAAAESRREDEERRERMQLRAAEWQDNDMVDCGVRLREMEVDS